MTFWGTSIPLITGRLYDSPARGPRPCDLDLYPETDLAGKFTHCSKFQICSSKSKNHGGIYLRGNQTAGL